MKHDAKKRALETAAALGDEHDLEQRHDQHASKVARVFPTSDNHGGLGSTPPRNVESEDELEGADGGARADALAPDDAAGKRDAAKKEGKPTRYKGVYIDRNVSNKWKSSIRLNQREVHLGYYESEEEASRAYDQACICVKGETKNHPMETYDRVLIEELTAMNKDVELLRRKIGVGHASRDCSSKHRGVCFEKKTKKWRAEVQINGKKESLGYHAVEDDAVRAYDKACIVLKGERAKTNHPLETYADEMEQLGKWTFEQYQGTLKTNARRHASWTSKYRGVRQHTHNQKQGGQSVKWRAEITIDGKKKSLGYHDTEDAAARAYDDAFVIMKGCRRELLNFPDRSMIDVVGGAAGGAEGAEGGGADHASLTAAGRAFGAVGATTKSVGGVKGKKVAAAAAQKAQEGAVQPGNFIASLEDP
jgi:hypothetical protein